MEERKAASGWTTAPERRFSDIVSQSASWDEERLREALRKALLALLASGNPSTLVLPPVKGFAPKRLADRKDLHYHRSVEVGIVLSGEMTIWWEGKLSRLPANSIFIIPPGIRYLPHVSEPESPPTPHSVVWLELHRDTAMVHQCSLEGKIHRLSEYYWFTESLILNQARSLAQEMADREPHYEAAVRGSVLCLLTWLLRAPVRSISRNDVGGGEPQKRGSEPDGFQERVESYFLSNYHRPLSLTQIADAMGCSPAYLCRQFRKLSGQTPFQFLRSVRMDAAKRLLSSGLPVGRVAAMVGFDDPLYFSKVFSSQTGLSPQKFRTSSKP